MKIIENDFEVAVVNGTTIHVIFAGVDRYRLAQQWIDENEAR